MGRARCWRGERSALGHSLSRGLAGSVGHHHSGLQVAADQAQNLPVPDLPAQLLHQPVVVDRVKEAFEKVPRTVSRVLWGKAVHIDTSHEQLVLEVWESGFS
jgi:hypothetical protein